MDFTPLTSQITSIAPVHAAEMEVRSKKLQFFFTITYTGWHNRFLTLTIWLLSQ